MSYHILTFPFGGDGYVSAVYSHMVILFRHFGRIVFEMSSPSISGVHIYRVAVAVKLPYAGDGNSAPVRSVVSGLFKTVIDHLVGVGYPAEFPFAVK